MMTAPFARFGGFPFAFVAALAVTGVPTGPTPQEAIRSVTAEAEAPHRQRRRASAAAPAEARLSATVPVLTRRGTRIRPVAETVTLAAGPDPHLVTTLTRRGSRLRPVAQTGVLAALQ